MKKEEFDDIVRMYPAAAEIRLEGELAALVYPNYSISYDENGHYWKMNDTRISIPNFKGFVPKWLRDNGASFALMIAIRKFPVQLSGGVAMYDRTGEHRIAQEMYLDREFDYDHESERDLHERVTRLVILKGAIHLALTENLDALF